MHIRSETEDAAINAVARIGGRWAWPACELSARCPLSPAMGCSS